MKFSEYLNQYIHDNRIKQGVLAEAIGIGQPTLSSWKKGKNIPNGANVIKVVEYFNLTQAELIEMNLELDVNQKPKEDDVIIELDTYLTKCLEKLENDNDKMNNLVKKGINELRDKISAVVDVIRMLGE